MKSNKYKEKMMIILILILIIAIISGVFLFVYIHSVSKVLEKIRNQLENAILGEYTIIDYNDGYESAIGEEVNKLLSIFQDQRKKQKKEQKIMQQFLADVSHQIKTPLSNIIVYSELVDNSSELSNENHEMLRLVCNQAEKLDFFVSMLIKASRVELEMIEIRKRIQPLDELIHQCCEEKSYAAKKNNIQFAITRCEEKCPYDIHWMQEAISNVLDNAIKYSPSNSIIEIWITKYGLYWCIHIKDSGCGIDEKEQGLIFQRFYRSESSCDKQGLGIGLYLTREIVYKHAGYIEVYSKPGQGAEFCIYLPQK